MEKEKQIKNAEIIFSSFMADHNIAFCNVEHLVPMLRNTLPDSQILKDVQLHRKKCIFIMKNVIAKVETENLINILKTVNLILKCILLNINSLFSILGKFFNTNR